MRDRQAVLNRATPGAVITDGSHSLRFEECHAALESLRSQLSSLELAPGQALALRCEDSVAGALLLLCLLEDGRAFVIERADESDEPLPALCRHRVAAELDATGPPRLRVLMSAQASAPSGTAPYVYFRTSGTTGAPKFVAHRHERLVANARNCIERLGLSEASRVAIPVPIHHMYGLGAALLPSLLAGAGVDLVPRANLLRLLERERAFDPNVAFLTPAFADGLVRGRRAARGYALTVTAGDALRAETAAGHERLCGPIVQLYGSTELGAVAAGRPADSPELRHASAGTPFPGVELRLETEPQGSLLCRHSFGFDGYVDAEGQLEVAPEWFPTRDLAELDGEGRVRLLGRLDHSVKRDGVLVALATVEQALAGLGGLASSAVVAMGEARRGTAIVAWCVPATGAALTPEKIREACFELLPRRAVPDRVELVDALPLLPSGKVDRQALKRNAEERGSR